MTKKMVSTRLAEVKSSLDGYTLEEALHKIKQWIQLYGGKAKLEIGQESEEYSYSDKEYAYVNIVGMREESDEVYNRRLEHETKIKELQEARDKTEFERLQKKFGGTQ